MCGKDFAGRKGSAFAATWYRDADRDGYGNPNIRKTANKKPSGYVSNNLDCNDSNRNTHPGAVDLCGNGVDEDCNGQSDEGCLTYYQDADGESRYR